MRPEFIFRRWLSFSLPSLTIQLHDVEPALHDVEAPSLKIHPLPLCFCLFCLLCLFCLSLHHSDLVAKQDAAPTPDNSSFEEAFARAEQAIITSQHEVLKQRKTKRKFMAKGRQVADLINKQHAMMCSAKRQHKVAKLAENAVNATVDKFRRKANAL